MFLFGLILGIVIAIAAPIIYKKYKPLLPTWLQF
jgi:hypothetical protein